MSKQVGKAQRMDIGASSGPAPWLNDRERAERAEAEVARLTAERDSLRISYDGSLRDLGRLADVTGLGSHARPYPPAQLMNECITEVARLTAERDTYKAGVEVLAKDYATALARLTAERDSFREVAEAARETEPILAEIAEEVSYGAPCVTDPRDFTPDAECCTPTEVAAWKAACERAAAGEQVEIPQHKWGTSEDGKTVYHVSYEPWGIGTSRMVDPVTKIALDHLRAALARLDAPKEAQP